MRYLLRHPNAQDTLEGISEWWLLEERLVQKYAEVEEALTKLVGKGFVLEKRLFNSDVIISLNKAKKNLIEEIIDDAESLEE